MNVKRLVSLTLFALVSSTVSADPRPLTDDQLDQITAGTAGDHEPSIAATGGNVIAGEATASIAGQATINIEDNAQTGARGLSLVNSADAAVASGVNLWDGAVNDVIVGSGINVLQSNELLQDSRSPFATLFGYKRGEGSLRDVTTWGDSTAPVQLIEFGLQLDIDGVGSFDGRGEIPAAVIPSAKIPGSYGNVVGFAGDLGIEFDGGSFATGLSLDSSLTAGAHLDASTTTSILWGLIDVGEADIYSGTLLTASFNPYITIGAELPDLSILGQGAVCYANGGKCRSSLLERDIASLYVPSATAEYIVIDRSVLEATHDYEVSLGAEAQADARAVTLVNAAGGLVAHGANLATASDAGFGAAIDEPVPGSQLAVDVLFLDQDNNVQQTRGLAHTDRRHNYRFNPGGALVANESIASLLDSRSVILTSGAQSGARAVTLVNSADTLVATGVNVWDGRLQNGAIGNRVDMSQDNELVQYDGMNSASVAGYDRGAESLYHTWTVAESASTPKSLGTEFTLNILGSDDPAATLTGNLSIPASLIPTSKIPGLGGTTAAFAGNVDVHLDGGSLDFGFGIEDSYVHFETHNSITGGGNIGLIDVDGGASYSNYTDAMIHAALELHIDMPDLDVEVDGAACFAQKGYCEAGVTDRSIGGLDVDEAAAEYIVLDRSGLSAETLSNVALDNGAQADARAVNLFNAAGGSIAGGTNIASWRGEENTLTLPLLNLAQDNSLMQTSGFFARGSAPGGVVVAYESLADITNSGSVAITGGAQRGVRALNLVNSSDAMVGNGLNLWTGNLTDAEFDESINVQQSNLVMQQTPLQTAMLGGYHRDDQSSRSVFTMISTKPDPAAEHEFFPTAMPGHIFGEVRLEIGDLVDFERTGWVPTSIIPTSKIPGGKPGGLAFAGDAFLHYDGGGLDFSSTTGTHFSSTTDADADNTVQVFFGLAEGGGESTYFEHSEIDFTTSLDVFVDMPDLTIDVHGAGCIVKSANCVASVVEREDGDLRIAHGAAEYIVVDRSMLNVMSNYSVALSDEAQADAQALVIVNAAGGHIANGLNVSRLVANNLTAQPNFAQSNVVVQGVAPLGQLQTYPEFEMASGGSIVAGGSGAVLDRNAVVNLSNNAQDGARALLIVNSADAAVGHGINVWHGDFIAAGLGHAINLAQTNQVHQYAMPTTARLYGYDRGPGYVRDTSVVADSRAEIQYIRAGFKIDIPDIASYYEGLVAPASAIPTSKVPGARGIVTGFAGTADVTYGGGSVDVLFGIDGHLGYQNLLTTTASAGDFLGFGTTEGYAEFGIDEFTVNFAPTFFFTADLPTLQIMADGALCWANGGTCTAGIREEQQGELSICTADAENIVVDQAVLEVTESYSIALDNGAQANAQALAIVNAAGGLVANGINVASLNGTTLDTSSVNLVQRNVIVQGN